MNKRKRWPHMELAALQCSYSMKGTPMIDLVGKTIASINYVDPWGEGLRITFTDGTTMRVTERMQAGEIEVYINGKTAEYEHNFED